MSPLQQLRSDGFRVTASDGRIVVEPGSAIPETTRQMIRANKAEILGELGRDAQLDLRSQFVAALKVGAFVVCSRCSHYQPRVGAYPDGHCGRFDEQAWGRVPFSCDGYSAR